MKVKEHVTQQWLTDAYLIVFGQQWSFVAQRNSLLSLIEVYLKKKKYTRLNFN